MSKTPRMVPALVALAAAGAFVLSACAPSPAPQSPESKSASSPSSTSAAPATHSATASSATSSATSKPSEGPAACISSGLTASLGAGSGGGAGHQYPAIVLTNSGGSACTVTGYPGVSFVGDNNGTQLGAPADRDPGSGEQTIVLQPGESAHANLSVTEATNYDQATCEPTPADGFRVYPPGETAAMYIPAPGFTACANADTVILKIQPFQAGAA